MKALTNKEAYRQLCERVDNIPLFAQHWWMEATTQSEGKQWDVAMCRNAEGEIVGALPYLISKRMGLRFVLMPQLTQVTNVWINSKRETEYERITNELIAQILALQPVYCYLSFNPQNRTNDAFSHAGFSINERITYRINNLSQSAIDIETHFSQNKRRHLKKAKNLTLDIGMSIEDFYAFHTQCLAKRKQTISYSRQLINSIGAYTATRNQGCVLAARNTEGTITAAVFLVWDSEICYYLTPSYDSDYKDSGAMTWLTLEAIRFAQQHSKHFDFEGSMIPSIANSYRQFGTTPTTYWSVERFANPLIKLLWKLF